MAAQALPRLNESIGVHFGRRLRTSASVGCSARTCVVAEGSSREEGGRLKKRLTKAGQEAARLPAKLAEAEREVDGD